MNTEPTSSDFQVCTNGNGDFFLVPKPKTFSSLNRVSFLLRLLNSILSLTKTVTVSYHYDEKKGICETFCDQEGGIIPSRELVRKIYGVTLPEIISVQVNLRFEGKCRLCSATYTSSLTNILIHGLANHVQSFEPPPSEEYTKFCKNPECGNSPVTMYSTKTT